MALAPNESLPYFENKIYLPMLITILNNDLKLIQATPFKLKSPYINFVEKSIELIETDLRNTNIYLNRNKMQLIKLKNDGSFTEYIFRFDGKEEIRRYSNVRLRNRTEELQNMYFYKEKKEL